MGWNDGRGGSTKSMVWNHFIPNESQVSIHINQSVVDFLSHSLIKSVLQPKNTTIPVCCRFCHLLHPHREVARSYTHHHGNTKTFICDADLCMLSTKNPVPYDTQICILLYAYDTVLIAPDENKLQVKQITSSAELYIRLVLKMEDGCKNRENSGGSFPPYSKNTNSSWI